MINYLIGAAFIAVHLLAKVKEDRLQHQRLLDRIERQVNLYGHLFSSLLCSRHMYVEFARLEGFSYPEDFMSFVDAIDSRPDSGIAKRYRTLMTDVLGPIQLEILELISCNESLIQADEDDGLYDLLLDYRLMASSYRLIFSRWRTGDFSIHFSHWRSEKANVHTRDQI